VALSHHTALPLAYAIALAGALGVARRLPRLWPGPEPVPFSHPWREVGWALLATAAVLAIGMAYARGWLLPATSRHRPGLDAANQLLIYSPFLLLLVLRRHDAATAWLPHRAVLQRVAVGLLLALVALAVYAAIRLGIRQWPLLVVHVYQPAHVSHLVQVLLEDIAIAIGFVRFHQALGLRWALLLVAALFAAAHIPGLLAHGARAGDLVPLLGDLGLVVLALSVLQRLRDVWWFWMVHFALDMTQFYAMRRAASLW
jgi:hypothetical protein